MHSSWLKDDQKLISYRSPFTGSLGSKRKHELVEIAEALNISDPEAKMTELKDKIQSYLDTNESKLSKDAQFKGLYGKKRLYVCILLLKSYPLDC